MKYKNNGLFKKLNSVLLTAAVIFTSLEVPTLGPVFAEELPLQVGDIVGNYGCARQTELFTAPATGLYTIEAFGGDGGGSANQNGFGAGGCTKGDILLEAGQQLYITVGGKGAYNTNGIAAGGYNGGGTADGINVGGGGGATVVALTNDNLSIIADSDLILVAGGGGGSSKSSLNTSNVGSGGGLTTSIDGSTCGVGGTQTSGYAKGIGQSQTGSLGAGGGGYYGGFASTSVLLGGGGGSGYVNTSKLTNYSSSTVSSTSYTDGKVVITYKGSAVSTVIINAGSNGTIDGNTTKTITGDYGSTIVLPEPTPNESFVSFDKYVITTGNGLLNGTNFTFGSDITYLDACYKGNTVTIDAVQNLNDLAVTVDANSTSAITVPVQTKQGNSATWNTIDTFNVGDAEASNVTKNYNVNVVDYNAPEKPVGSFVYSYDADTITLQFETTSDKEGILQLQAQNYTDVKEFSYASGFKGWYYYIDDNSTGIVSSSNTFVSSATQGRVLVDVNSGHYVHVATVDNDGNISDTVNFEIKNTIKVLYDSNMPSATGSLKSQILADDGSVTVKDNVTVGDDIAFEKAGWVIKYWNTAADGSGRTYNFLDTLNFSDINDASNPITLYAIWQPDYNIIYHTTVDNLGIVKKHLGTTTTHTVETATSVGAVVPTTKLFKGWYITDNSTGAVSDLMEGEAISDIKPLVNSNNELHIYMKLIENSFTLNFNVDRPNKASATPVCNPISKTVSKGSAIGSLPTPTLTGWHIVTNNDKIWNVNNLGYIDANTVYPFENNAEATVSFEPNYYKINYNLNGGTFGELHPTGCAYDTELLISNPTKKDYIFTGWTITGYSTQTSGVVGTTWTNETGTSFYNLTPTDKATVTFTANWTKLTEIVAVAQWESKVLTNFKKPTMYGYKFLDWYDYAGKFNENEAEDFYYGKANTTTQTTFETDDIDEQNKKYYKDIDETKDGTVDVGKRISSLTVNPDTSAYKKTLYARWAPIYGYMNYSYVTFDETKLNYLAYNNGHLVSDGEDGKLISRYKLGKTFGEIHDLPDAQLYFNVNVHTSAINNADTDAQHKYEVCTPINYVDSLFTFNSPKGNSDALRKAYNVYPNNTDVTTPTTPHVADGVVYNKPTTNIYNMYGLSTFNGWYLSDRNETYISDTKLENDTVLPFDSTSDKIFIASKYTHNTIIHKLPKLKRYFVFKLDQKGGTISTRHEFVDYNTNGEKYATFNDYIQSQTFKDVDSLLRGTHTLYTSKNILGGYNGAYVPYEFTFTNWTTKTGAVVTENTLVDADTDYYANWAKQNEMSLPQLEKPGYVFLGWYTEPQPATGNWSLEDNSVSDYTAYYAGGGYKYVNGVITQRDPDNKLLMATCSKINWDNPNNTQVLYAWYNRKPVFVDIYEGLFYEGQDVSFADLQKLVAVLDYEDDFKEEYQNEAIQQVWALDTVEESDLYVYLKKEVDENTDEDFEEDKGDVVEDEDGYNEEPDSEELVFDKETWEKIDDFECDGSVVDGIYLNKKDGKTYYTPQAKQVIIDHILALQTSDLSKQIRVKEIKYLTKDNADGEEIIKYYDDTVDKSNFVNTMMKPSQYKARLQDYFNSYYTVKLEDYAKTDKGAYDLSGTIIKDSKGQRATLDTSTSRIVYRNSADPTTWYGDFIVTYEITDGGIVFGTNVILGSDVTLDYQRTCRIQYNNAPILYLSNVTLFSNQIDKTVGSWNAADLEAYILSRQIAIDGEDSQSNIPWWTRAETLNQLEDTLRIISIWDFEVDSSYSKDPAETKKGVQYLNANIHTLDQLLKLRTDNPDLYKHITSFLCEFDVTDQFGKSASNRTTSHAQKVRNVFGTYEARNATSVSGLWDNRTEKSLKTNAVVDKNDGTWLQTYDDYNCHYYHPTDLTGDVGYQMATDYSDIPYQTRYYRSARIYMIDLDTNTDMVAGNVREIVRFVSPEYTTLEDANFDSLGSSYYGSEGYGFADLKKAFSIMSQVEQGTATPNSTSDAEYVNSNNHTVNITIKDYTDTP